MVRIEKVIKKKGDKLYVKGKVMIICLMARYIGNISLYRMSCYQAPDNGRNKIKIELDLYSYATKP